MGPAATGPTTAVVYADSGPGRHPAAPVGVIPVKRWLSSPGPINEMLPVCFVLELFSYPRNAIQEEVPMQPMSEDILYSP